MPFYKQYVPSDSLKNLIREYHVYHLNWNLEEGLPLPYITCLANTEQNLYFILKDKMKVVLQVGLEISAPVAIITGPKTKPVGLLYGKNHLMVKVAFQPTGFYRLTAMDMQEFCNKGLDASPFLEGIEALNRSLCNENNYDQMIHTVDSYFCTKVDKGIQAELPIDNVCREMLNPLNDYSLPEWASQACISLRQFERKFTRMVGIGPKLFRQIIRFEHIMKVKSVTNKSWRQIAFESGLSDGSHLLKQFRKFAEFPPNEFYLKPTSGFSEVITS